MKNKEFFNIININTELKKHFIKQIDGQLCMMLEVNDQCHDDKISCEKCIKLTLKKLAEE